MHVNLRIFRPTIFIALNAKRLRLFIFEGKYYALVEYMRLSAESFRFFIGDKQYESYVVLYLIIRIIY